MTPLGVTQEFCPDTGSGKVSVYDTLYNTPSTLCWHPVWFATTLEGYYPDIPGRYIDTWDVNADIPVRFIATIEGC